MMKRVTLPFQWPDPPLNVVLVEPKIPPNTGNIARLCAATGSALHLVEPLGFSVDNASLRRAGLDYWDSVRVKTHPSLDAFLAALPADARIHLMTTRGATSCFDAHYQPGDYLFFGSETEGLTGLLLDRYPDRTVNIPVRLDHVRSLNLSSSAAIVVYEALRQLQPPGRAGSRE